MPKKIIFIFVVAIFGFATYFLLPKDRNVVTTINKIETKQDDKTLETTSSLREVAHDGSMYRYAFRKITNDITLVPNFERRLTSAEIIDQYNCAYGINGGFYTKENTPLGLFFANNKYYGQNIASNTFNAYIAKNKTNGSLQILTSIEDIQIEEKYDSVFQTGPIFDLKSDFVAGFDDKEYARRNLLAKDSYGEYYFFTIFHKESRYAGPRLQDIVPIFKSNYFRLISDFDTVINLDGGSASAYYDESSNTKVGEITPVGSFLCGISQ